MQVPRESWELLSTDDLVVIADSLEGCVAKLKTWKSDVELKGLRFNMKKTKFLVSGVGLDVLKDVPLHCLPLCLWS